LHGSKWLPWFGRGQHGLRLDAPLELQMQTLDGIGGARRLPLLEGQPREREELVAGQIVLRKVDGWMSIQQPLAEPIDLAA
jgi:hypothetical protein